MSLLQFVVLCVTAVATETGELGVAPAFIVSCDHSALSGDTACQLMHLNIATKVHNFNLETIQIE